ncbi:MAG TPA: hypothetical protein VFZ78_10200 [Flavisolibacter sp.]
MKKLFFRKSDRYLPVKQKPLPPLALCLLLDMLGCASYLLPFFGEFFDLVWAPISAILYWKLFGGIKGFFGGAFSFFEELMPGLDIIPTFTITWFLQYHKRHKEAIPAGSLKKDFLQF